MRILHFTLGLPPLRSGGLTKYAYDLMNQQAINGDKVFELSCRYTSVFGFLGRSIKKIKYNGKFEVYELNNGVPIPLLNGVKSPKDFLLNSDSISIKDLEHFYAEIRPEVLHIHTLMGISKKVVQFLKKKGVKVVFSSHDYYGLCFKVNFIDFKGNVCSEICGRKCAKCNSQSPSTSFLKLRNYKVFLKNKGFFGALFRLKESFKVNQSSVFGEPKEKNVADYQALINYYREVFDLTDLFHFNSEVSKQVYCSFIYPKRSCVIPISNQNIEDNREFRSVANPIRIGFIGPASKFKGLPLLRDVLIELEKAGVNNWRLKVWGNNLLGKDSDSTLINYCGKYKQDDLRNVFDSIDLLVVPSIWKETFSLISLEALSYGVPVLVSENVGAKDIVRLYDERFIFQATFESLYYEMRNLILNPSIIESFNNNLVSRSFDYSIKKHANKIKNMYLTL